MACYNVEKYIDDFFRSIFIQAVDPDCLEIITVDDGSTDLTAARIADWAQRFPASIRYLHQPNQGQAVARNTGLACATGEWVSFPDPDDTLSTSYFEEVHAEIARAHSQPLSMVACNLVFFKEAKRSAKEEDTHPLRYRFEQERTILPASDLQDHMQLSTATAWLRRELIERNELRFDPRVVPTFEDGHFVNRFLLLNAQTEVAFLMRPIYHYRKRGDGSSTLDGAKLTAAWCLDALRYGYLDLLNQAQTIAGEVPRFIQRTVLYDILWRFHYLLDHPERVVLHTPAERKEFMGLLEKIFAGIESKTINTFDLAYCTEEHKVGLLGLMKEGRRPVTKAYLRQYDEAKGLLQLSYYSPHPDLKASAYVNEKAVPLSYVSRRSSKFLDHNYFFEHFFWVPLGLGDYLTVSHEGRSCDLMRDDQHLGALATFEELQRALRPPAAIGADLPKEIGELQRIAGSAAAKTKYGGCWVFVDRPGKADDNAEHLYRHLLLDGQAQKMFFVLHDDSADWRRLLAEGFQLLPFGSEEHRIALINARFLISSHPDEFKVWPGPKSADYEAPRYRFVFLQHGVTKDDISRWINTKRISLLITATPAEYKSIADPELDYRLSEKEVVLTGFPRHDRLWSMSKTATTLLVTPTWRKYLLDKKYQPIPSFTELEYVRRWSSLLHSPMLRRLAEQHGLKLAFCAHPAIAPFAEVFATPDYVEVINPLTTESLQPLFARTALCITDYSSVAFDMAYVEKPVIYYQFDIDQFYKGGHVGVPGYFDYERDGFGPICETEGDVLSRLEAALSGNESPQYAERRRLTFPYRDGQCCKRVCECIEELDAPRENAELQGRQSDHNFRDLTRTSNSRVAS